MQTPKNTVMDAPIHMEHAFHGMPFMINVKPLPANRQEIVRSDAQRLTPDEQRICDMATD